MEFEWDRAKARGNRKKHGVDFADAVEVFFDRRAVTIPDEHTAEKRFVTIGSDTLSRVLVVVYCWRADHIRVISARRATRLERQRYEEQR
jgi:uncharacterized DUF497 family protein